MKLIKLTKGKSAIVDDADYNFLTQWKWNFDGRYACRSQHICCVNGKQKQKKIYMHILINGTKQGEFTDHVNANKLDNRKINLRSCDATQNKGNISPYAGYKYKGISFDKRRNSWYAYIDSYGKRKHLGSYKSEVDAAQAYNNAAKEYYGEFARFNIIEDVA